MLPHHHTLDRNRARRLAAEHPQAHPRPEGHRREAAANVPRAVLPAAARIAPVSDARQRLPDGPPTRPHARRCRRRGPTTPGPNAGPTRPSPGTSPRRPATTPSGWPSIRPRSPCHGRPSGDLGETYRGRAKDGTGHLHAHATAYVVREGRRYTVASAGVEEGESPKGVARRRPRPAAGVGVRARLPPLECGSYSVAVARYPRRARYPFLMPAVRHGRSPRQPGGPAGSHALRARERSGWPEYTPTDAKERAATVSTRAECRDYRGQRERPGRRASIDACWGSDPPSPDPAFAR